tara:strand:- start:3 stop:752 length:750 start_codon:yes stop_codon:yes gene_type:complete
MSANSFRAFQDYLSSGYKAPSKSNLFELMIPVPPCVALEDESFITNRGAQEHYDSINYLASSVTVPGRRVTTSEVRDVGVSRKYATNTAFGDLQVEFLVTKDQYHRDFFEQWMLSTAPDQENRAGFYEQYTTTINVLKWENASNVLYKPPVTVFGKEVGTTRLNRSSAVWQMYGAFPYDMSEQSFNNGPTDLVKLNVGFYFERYRFDRIGNNTVKFGSNISDTTVNSITDVASKLGFVLDQKDVARVGI